MSSEADDSDSSDFDENAEDSDENINVTNSDGNKCDQSQNKFPSAFRLKRHPCHCVCLPREPLVAVSDHKGILSLFNFGSNSSNLSSKPEVTLKHVEKLHNSFFFVDANSEATKIVSAGDGRSIAVSDVERGLKIISRISKAHGSSISAVCWYNDNCVVTGDTRGRIKAFDVRVGGLTAKKSRVFKFYENEGEITDFSGDSNRKYLLASSADSSMSTIDFRRAKFIMQSQPSSNGEMRSVVVMSEETKVLCGLSDGHVQIYEMGLFGVHVESLPIFDQIQHAEADLNLDKIRAVNENIYVVSDDNGSIHAYSLFPNRRIAKIGCHKLSTECFDVDHSGDLLVSCGADRLLKFWDVSLLTASEILEKRSKRKTKQQIMSIRRAFDPAASFFADID